MGEGVCSLSWLCVYLGVLSPLAAASHWSYAGSPREVHDRSPVLKMGCLHATFAHNIDIFYLNVTIKSEEAWREWQCCLSIPYLLLSQAEGCIVRGKPVLTSPYMRDDALAFQSKLSLSCLRYSVHKFQVPGTFKGDHPASISTKLHSTFC